MSDSIVLCSKCGNSQPRFQSSAFEKVKAYTTDNVDRALVATLAARANNELQAYDGQIKSVKEILKKLRGERKKALEHRDRCRYLISAVRRVPPETWLEILGFACLEEDDCRWQNPAVRLASVCERLQTMERDFSVVPNFLDSIPSRLSGRTQCHLSKIHPVAPRAVFSAVKSQHSESYGWNGDEPYLLPRHCSTEALRYILEFSDRISSFRFHGSDIRASVWIQSLAECQEQPPRGFANLETLTLGSGETHTTFNGEELDLGLFSGAVNLRHLSLSKYSGELCPSSWAQLTTVNLNSVEIAVVHHLLSHCQNLTQAVISDVLNPVITPIVIPLAPCVSNSLISLIIDGDHPTRYLLSSLMLPALQSLQIQSSIKAIEVLALCQRSSFPLRHISLCGSEFNAWQELFLALPSTVSSFGLSGAVSQEFIDRLTWAPNNTDSPFLPGLTTLDIRCVETSLDSVITMVESRFYDITLKLSIARLIKVTIHAIKKRPSSGPPSVIDPLILDRVTKLAEAGLAIVILRTLKP
ncbi:hypothetical protein C8J56DRAFT_1101013 [Mycena floridula]|nr:hypothetical protein C8J56DRAFT_1101013 [Mycena floridula]